MLIFSRQVKTNLSRDMKKIRKKYAGFSVNEVVKEIKKYYHKYNLDETVLLNRITRLETEMSFKGNLLSSITGALLGLIVIFSGSLNIDKLLVTSSGTGSKETLLRNIIIILFAIIAVAFFSICITLLVILMRKFHLFVFRNDGRDDYLDKKEIEIIIDKIENNYENTEVKKCKKNRCNHIKRT